MQDLSFLLNHLHVTRSEVSEYVASQDLDKPSTLLLEKFLQARFTESIPKIDNFLIIGTPNVSIEQLNIFSQGLNKYLFSYLDIDINMLIGEHVRDSKDDNFIETEIGVRFNQGTTFKPSYEAAFIIEADIVPIKFQNARGDPREIGGYQSCDFAFVMQRVLTKGCFRDGKYLGMNEEERIEYAGRVIAHEVYHSVFNGPDITPKWHLPMGHDDKRCLGYSRFNFEAKFCDDCVDLMRAKYLGWQHNIPPDCSSRLNAMRNAIARANK